jgi:starch synthase
MEIIHVTAECYPIAKAGGLGDVLGALPKYQQVLGHTSKVVMPMYKTKYLYTHQFDVVHKGGSNLAGYFFDYTIIKEASNELGFELYLVDINGLLDREQIYGYEDDTERFIAFQIAVLDWICSWATFPHVIHVHDYHTALIPFMMQHSYRYNALANIPSVLTIHNAQYQGQFGWQKSNCIPAWDPWKSGLLEWNNAINPLVTGIKSAWKVTTVSPNYMNELRSNSNGLEPIFEYEKGKCSGILNGIDVNVWNPATDKYLNHHFNADTSENGKHKNKQELCETFGLSIDKPLFVFIGRLVGEKAADLLPQVISDCFNNIGRTMNFLILGSGEPIVERALEGLKNNSENDFNVYIGYNETLSHKMYAGADFLLMPSRVEPCGLNQLYALRYGTVPVVRKTGGLQDTVKDFMEINGYGVTFNNADVGDITHAIFRSLQLYQNSEKMTEIRTTMMELDFSWDKSADDYIKLYASLQ